MRFLTKRTTLTLLALTALPLLAHRWRVHHAWQAMLETGQALEQSSAQLDATRPVLYGEAQAGNAHEQYALAISMLNEGILEDWLEVQRAREEASPDANALRDALVADNAEALAVLKLGAHALDAEYALDWDGEQPPRAPRMMGSRNLMSLAVLAADKLLDEGKQDLAADTLLDGLQMAGDTMRCPMLIGQMIGCALLDMGAGKALVEEGLIDKFEPVQLKRLGIGMAQLQASLPSMQAAFDTELAWFIRSSEQATRYRDFSLEGDLEDWLVAARYGFSTRLMIAEYVEGALAWRGVEPARGERSWEEWNEEWDRFAASMNGTGNPLWGVMETPYRSAEISRRSQLTRFNMTRCAIEYRLSGELLGMRDLFGDRLLMERVDDHVRISSVGPDEANGHQDWYSLQIRN